MGLRTGGCYAKVWKIEPKEKYTKVQISISKKDRATGQYETDWSGFTNFVGQAHTEIAKFKEGDRVKIEEFEITNKYDKEKKLTSTYCSVFKISDASNNTPVAQPAAAKSEPDDPSKVDDDGLPF